jgi:hypothetical protein
MMKIYWKGKRIWPYETFYWTQTERFFHGTTGDGLGRTITATPGLFAICELVYECEQDEQDV